MDNSRIDPWGSDHDTNYDRVSSRFGLDGINLEDLSNPGMLHTRGLIFAHRDLDVIMHAHRRGSPFGVLTGLMPSGKMHLGHTMVIEQAKWYQSLGADVTVAVADLESLATRAVPLEKGRQVALEEYVSNYAAMGLDPEKTSVYFQSSRPEVQRLGFTLGRRTNLSELGSIYGFEGNTNLAHVQAPLVQVGDILHPMLDKFGGLRPVVVPVGVDQDPHIRLTRDIVSKSQWFNVHKSKNGGILISLSIQPENHRAFGVKQNLSVDKSERSKIISKIEHLVSSMGFSDIQTNPKHGTITIHAGTAHGVNDLRLELCKLERELGGIGLLPPSSSYHKFAIGLDGGKMSSSKPETTIFLNESIEAMKRKIMKAHSGGKSTVEEHRRLGGDLETDVAFQYLKFFFEKDDAELTKIAKDYTSGRILAGEMKKLCAQQAEIWMNELTEKRAQWSDKISDFLADDAIQS